VTYVITEPCIDVKDKSCIEECPVDCIYEGDRMLYIHPDECVDCGACEPVCPVEAIFYEDDVPAQWKDFTATNAAFFTEGEDPLGSPGGAAKVGPHVYIRTMPGVGGRSGSFVLVRVLVTWSISRGCPCSCGSGNPRDGKPAGW
jgi:ferredoxin